MSPRSPLKGRHRGSGAVSQTPQNDYLSVSRPEGLPEPLPSENSSCGASGSKAPTMTTVGGSPVLDASVRFARAAGFLLIGCSVSAATVLMGPWQAVTHRMLLIENYMLGPLYLALVLLYLAYHTAGLQLGTVFRPTQIQMPDQKIYRILDGGLDVSGALVLVQDNGSFGNFARARQAAAALEESMPLFVAHLIAGGFVLPWTAMILSAIFGLSRAGSAAQTRVSGRSESPISWLSGAAEGAAAGVCLFVGLVSTARELSE
eukprot:TRINITY_DN73568_c0_g1_i1.p1 TRINITY_DN73568_c0_g1~~TRINITY_DN73568_c0_g1_i1.p1  ORF type:complete len:261 (-),score=37.87 TRINITY_DN73568_c0_g1_i1:297-1079(-)